VAINNNAPVFDVTPRVFALYPGPIHQVWLVKQIQSLVNIEGVKANIGFGHPFRWLGNWASSQLMGLIDNYLNLQLSCCMMGRVVCGLVDKSSHEGESCEVTCCS